MMSILKNEIKQCIRARKGYKDPYRCGSDHCNDCSKSRTEWFRQEVEFFLHDVEEVWFTTTLIKARNNVPAMENDAVIALNKYAACDVNAIGAIEYATKENTSTKNWLNFIEHSGYIPSLHNAVVHAHTLSRESIKDKIIDLFPGNRQIVEIKVKTLPTLAHHVNRIVNYCRDRSSCNEWWINEDVHDQLLFSVSGNGWIKSVGNHWEDGCSDSSKSVDYGVGIGSKSGGMVKSILGESGDDGRRRVAIIQSTCTRDDQKITPVNHENKAMMILQKAIELRKQKAQEIKENSQPIIQKDQPKNEESMFTFADKIEKKKINKNPRIVIAGRKLYRDKDDLVRWGFYLKKGFTYRQMKEDDGWPDYERWLYKNPSRVEKL